MKKPGINIKSNPPVSFHWTSPTLESASGNTSLLASLQEAMLLKSQSREYKILSDAASDQARDLAYPLMVAVGMKKAEAEGFGTLYAKEGASSTYPESSLKEAMLEEGVNADVITRVLDRARRTTTYSYLEFRPWKEKKDK